MELTLELIVQLFVLFLLFNYAMFIINELFKLIMEKFFGKSIFSDINPNEKNYSKLESIQDTIKNIKSEIKGIKSSITSYGNKVSILEDKLDVIIEQVDNMEKNINIKIDNGFAEKLANTPITCNTTNSNFNTFKTIREKALELISNKTI